MRAMVLMMLVGLVGCSARGPSTVAVEPGRYLVAFDAAREALIEARFELDRVDARAGVITTRGKTTAGLGTPWDTEQSSASQEVEDLLNEHQRRVRVTFAPRGAAADDPAVDLREVSAPLTATVEVAVDRIRRPGWTLDATGVRSSGHVVDRRLRDRGLLPTYAVPFTMDDALAGRVAEAMRRALAGD